MYTTRKNNVNGFYCSERKATRTENKNTNTGAGCMFAIILLGVAVAIMYYISTIA